MASMSCKQADLKVRLERLRLLGFRTLPNVGMAVYVDGVCLNERTQAACGGIGIDWGGSNNPTWGPVPGEQTRQRAELWVCVS
jgi:hypothetical protein